MMKFVIKFDEYESKKFLEYSKRPLTTKEIESLEEAHRLYLAVEKRKSELVS